MNGELRDQRFLLENVAIFKRSSISFMDALCSQPVLHIQRYEYEYNQRNR